jgi:MFS family permease
MLPLTAGIMTGSIISGQVIARTGRYKVFPVLGTGLLTVGALMLSRLDVDTSMLYVSAAMVVFGLGLGGNMQPLVLAVQNAAERSDMGIATSSATFFRQMGGTLGVAVFLSILFWRRCAPGAAAAGPPGCCRTPRSSPSSTRGWPARSWSVSRSRSAA